MAEPILEIVGVTKVIKNQTIADGIHLSANAGQIVALCGANGAGKSTLLRMIAGVLRPTRGTILVNGLEWSKSRRAYAEQIGYMPDDYRFNGRLTAAENLRFWAALKGLPKSRADEALAEVGLQDAAGKPVSAFSKGMRQRLLFAQAMLSRPPLLILDEPTNGMDPYWADAFVRLTEKVRDSGRTVIFSTHQIQIAETLADRVVFMNRGRVVLDGLAGEIREREDDGLQGVFARLLGIGGSRIYA